MTQRSAPPLRRGWTTGACAAAAARAAYEALLTGRFPDPVTIALPGGLAPAFALATERLGEGVASAGIVKDAGDDPDVTHGALIEASLRPGVPGSGITFRAGKGVGTVTLPGLPLAVGEPAINPGPRAMIRDNLAAAARELGGSADMIVEISVPAGEMLAEKTWNPRLGILGGISILGTTGVVIPYSCSAWIQSIRMGVDVALADGQTHLAACTGRTSERAVRRLHGLPEIAVIAMGDFAGGLLKTVRRRPVPRLTVAGGFAKVSKIAEGVMDTHSARSAVDFARLAAILADLGADTDLTARAAGANTAVQVLAMAQKAGLPLADKCAEAARAMAQEKVGGEVRVDVVVFDSRGNLVGRAN